MKELLAVIDRIESRYEDQRKGAEILRGVVVTLEQQGLLKPSLDRSIQKPNVGLETQLFTPRQAAGFLNVSINTLKRYSDRELIPFKRINSRGDRRYPLDGLTDFLESKTSTYTPPAKK